MPTIYVGENGGESFFPKGGLVYAAVAGEALSTDPLAVMGHSYDIHRMTRATILQAGDNALHSLWLSGA